MRDGAATMKRVTLELGGKSPTSTRSARSGICDLNKYEATTHFLGQSTIFTLAAAEPPEKPTVWRIT
jgi:hypothetical protein